MDKTLQSQYEAQLQQQEVLIQDQTTQLQQQADRILQLESEIEQLKKLLEGKAQNKSAKKPAFSENYSLNRRERIKQQKEPKKSTGRKSNDAKRDLATLEVDVYHDDPKCKNLNHKDCIHHRTQYVWQLLDGKAIYVAYHIYDLPHSRNLPLPPNVRNSRSEFSLEIILTVAFLHFWIGVSLDHACDAFEFFTGIKLSKSQADSLLSQLSSDWDKQYDIIAELIALQTIVYIDETGWKVGKKSCYTWVFSTAKHVLFRCGVSRKKEEALAVIGDHFQGIGVTDDYAAYKNLFTQHQLCWAHLIRKAIKLALQYPDQMEYATFLDQLCGLYDDAKRLRMDARLSVSRAEKSRLLQTRVKDLCTRHEETILKNATPDDVASFILLQRELVTNLDSLFVFVEHPEVEPTNNRSERNARREAEIRKGSRTSKSASGAHRRSVIITVLASLRARIKQFTLTNFVSEIEDWIQNRCSIFEEELHALSEPVTFGET